MKKPTLAQRTSPSLTQRTPQAWGTQRASENGERQRWAAACATAGAAVWAGIAVLARMGVARLGAIELLFLLAPLVIVPLVMELGRVLGGGGWLEERARRLQPAGAALVVVAMWLRSEERRVGEEGRSRW